MRKRFFVYHERGYASRGLVGNGFGNGFNGCLAAGGRTVGWNVVGWLATDFVTDLTDGWPQEAVAGRRLGSAPRATQRFIICLPDVKIGQPFALGVVMKTLEEIKQLLSQNKQVVKEKYKISELGIFGSYVRGEQRQDSDLDVLIDYTEAPSLFQLVDLEFYLSERLQMKVDLVTKNGLKPRIKERILSEVVYL